MQIRFQKSLFLAGACAGLVGISGCNYDLAEEALSNNPAPVTQQDAASVPVSGELLGVDVLANDVDPEGEALFLINAAATVGRVEIENNSVNYYAPADYSGEVSVLYTISDGFWERTEFLSITVGDKLPENEQSEGRTPPSGGAGPLNRAPVAEDDLVEMAGGLGATIVHVLDNDQDPDGDPLYLLDVLISSGEGRASIFDRSVIYIAPKDFSGEVNLQYVVSDGSLNTVGNATVVVVSGNHPPVVREDRAEVLQGEVLTGVNVLANDEDPEKTPLKLVNATSGVGSVQFTESGEITFTPDVGFEGVALVAYTVSDGKVEAEGELLVTVTPAPEPENVAPIVVDDKATVVYGELLEDVSVLDNDFDPSGGTLKLVKVRPIVGSGASATIENDGTTITYQSPPGIYGDIKIFYTVSNGQAQAEGVLTVTVIEADADGGAVVDVPEQEPSSGVDGDYDVMLQVDSSDSFESYVIAYKNQSDSDYTFEVVEDNSGFVSLDLNEPGQYEFMVAPYVNGLTGAFSEEFRYSVDG